jgi:2'-5' RNA ligase
MRLADAHSRLVRPIPALSAHVTYALLAHLDPGLLPRAIEVLRSVAATIDVVDVTIDPAAVLFGGREARLVHAPVAAGAPALMRITERLATAFERAFPDAGVSASRAPHVTIARFRRGTTRTAARPIVEALALAAAPMTERFNDVQLVSSDLSASGPIYMSQATISFGPPDA